MKLFLYFFVFFGVCYYDASPPDPADINDTRPKLTLNMSGFTPGARAYVRFWDGSTPYTFPSNYQLYVDAGGRLQTEISLSRDGLTAGILVYIDENNNGLESSDFGYYQADIPVDPEIQFTTIDIPYAAGTLVSYNSAATLPSTGREICVYMPPGLTPYNISMNDTLPEYPTMGDTVLIATDWFPVTILDTAGIVSNVPLLSSWMTPSVNEVCVPE